MLVTDESFCAELTCVFSWHVSRFLLAQKEICARKRRKELAMKKHMLLGVIAGGLFGLVTAWIAMASALPAGGLVALAAAFDGIMAGAGIGWLIGINIAEGAVDEAEEEIAHAPGREHALAAR
jgi:membrane associated rhomboid family serine protease